MSCALGLLGFSVLLLFMLTLGILYRDLLELALGIYGAETLLLYLVSGIGNRCLTEHKYIMFGMNKYSAVKDTNADRRSIVYFCYEGSQTLRLEARIG